MSTIPKTGVYWPFKSLLEGAGISLVETADTVQIIATGGSGGGPGGGDMLKSEYAPTGRVGVVDHAILADTATNVTHAGNADHVPWTGITGTPTLFPTDWSYIANKPAVFATNWTLIAGIPATFPPSVHGAQHVSGGNDVIPNAAVGVSGLLGPLSGNTTDFLNGNGVFTDLLSQIGTGLSAGTQLTGNVDVPPDQTGYTKAPFLAQSATAGMFGAIGLHSQGYWGCALGAHQLGLYIATSTNSFVQLTDVSGHIIGGALATGAALQNLGFTPVNGSGGGTYVPTAPIILQRDIGLAANSYTLAVLRVQNATNAGRPQIGFLCQGVVGASLYLEAADWTFRYIRSDGAVARFHDTLHPLSGAELAAGAAIANIGYTPLNKAGDTTSGAIFVFQGDIGLGAASYAQAALQVTTYSTNPATRAGIGFQDRGRTGAFLYLDTDGALKYVTSGGAVRTLSYT